MRVSAIALALLSLLGDTPRIETTAGRRTITNAPAQSAGTKNVLVIGNSLSYFNEMPWLAEEMAKSKGASPPLNVEFSGRSGLSLEQQWKRGDALRRIVAQRWDFVVLQAQSTEAVRAPDVFTDYARRFDAEIRKRGAKTVILETWAPRGQSQKEFSARYAKVARELGALLLPVGTAWQSLQKRGVVLFDGSGVHPNVRGSYLYASMLYAMVYGRSASGAIHEFDVKFDIPEFYRQSLEQDRIDADTAAAIHDAAWLALRQR